MIKIILIGSFCMYLLLYHPGWVLLAGLIAGGLYILKRYDLTPAENSKDNEEEKPEDKGFTTYEERAEKEMNNTKFKEGFKNDIKWQTLAKKVGKHVEKAKDLEEAAMRAEAQNIKNMR